VGPGECSRFVGFADFGGGVGVSAFVPWVGLGVDVGYGVVIVGWGWSRVVSG